MRTAYWLGLIIIVAILIYFLYRFVWDGYIHKLYSVQFVVTSNSSPIAGANVILEDRYGSILEGFTDSGGYISFGGRDAGVYQYTVTAGGYYEKLGTISVNSDMNVYVELIEHILPPPSGNFSIGLYYLWHYSEDNPKNKDWLLEYSNGLSDGLNRLEDFMEQNDYARDITYKSAGELYTTAEIGKGLNMFGVPGSPTQGQLIQPVIDALSSLCSVPEYPSIIQGYDLVYVVMANMLDIFGPHGRSTDLPHTRRSPIYIGGRIFPLEARTNFVILEMEFFVTCGVPELREDPGEPTIMYPRYIEKNPGVIVLRSHEMELAKWSNWQKGEYGFDFCNSRPF